MSDPRDRRAAAQRLVVLHDEIDAEAEPLMVLHRADLQCKLGCADCCVDELTVFTIEADRIRARHSELLRDGEPHPPGACAFLGADKACRIYEDRPYVCRTQGLPLRWIEDDAELRDICPLNEAVELLELEPEGCWTIGPFEGRLATLQHQAHGDHARARLRDLFERGR